MWKGSNRTPTKEFTTRRSIYSVRKVLDSFHSHQYSDPSYGWDLSSCLESQYPFLHFTGLNDRKIMKRFKRKNVVT